MREIDTGWIEGVPGGITGDGGTGCLEGDSGLGIEGHGGLRSTKGTTSI